jgi:hypothetical protein
VDALSSKANSTGSTFALAKTTARSYARESKEWHWNDFSRDWESDITAQTARNSSRVAKKQAKEAAGTICSGPKVCKTASFGAFSGLKLDC